MPRPGQPQGEKSARLLWLMLYFSPALVAMESALNYDAPGQRIGTRNGSEGGKFHRVGFGNHFYILGAVEMG